jgi:ABC-2 type transport system permease protein
MSVVITIAAGILFLHVPFDPAQADWLLLFLSLVVGIIMLSMMGLILAAISLLTARHAGFLAEGVSSILFLFSGALYPLDVLPAWLQPVGYAIPITYWLELMRRAMIGNVAQAFPTLAGFSNLELLGILVGLSVVFGILSIFVFRACDRRARERGLIDRTTNY